MSKFIIPSLLFLFVTGSAFSQKKNDKDGAVVTIKIDGKERDIVEYFENWGEELGEKIERMFDDSKIHIDIDDSDFDIEFDNFSDNIGEIVESIAEEVTKAVTNMTIEIKDIDPHGFGDHINKNCDNDVEDIIDEIEDKYGSKIEIIDKMKIKIREDYVKIELDVTLENGKKVHKTKIFEH